MKHSIKDLEDSANWTILIKKLPAKLAEVKIDGDPKIACISFWKIDNPSQMITVRVPLDTLKSEIERQIEAALTS